MAWDLGGYLPCSELCSGPGMMFEPVLLWQGFKSCVIMRTLNTEVIEKENKIINLFYKKSETSGHNIYTFTKAFIVFKLVEYLLVILYIFPPSILEDIILPILIIYIGFNIFMFWRI